MANTTTSICTGKVRMSYVHVWQPKSINGSDAKYSVSLIIPKTDKETLNKIKAAIDAAKQEGLSKFGGKIPANLKTPLRDGDMDRPDDEAYVNSYFINANSATKPGVVDRNRQPIFDTTEFYSGCYGRVTLNFYAYNSNGNRGIACGLQNIQKLADGEPLGGRRRAEDDFDVWEDDDDFLS
ncbi:hypothetical protein DEAC_c23280 [Desulfosporosinus acididurans]|uniref:DUF2815 family protein n=1 Tax=Desulfosporosinus acididurans TaxID=476652 RepID=A0A0J1FRS9_9FIRM|nr:DUF2815 family protein [Desulfosporosinus acididurans]KLU65698.1 hypothetical protein DEAC_c23280 [Desulfosporosinus acididurans]